MVWRSLEISFHSDKAHWLYLSLLFLTLGVLTHWHQFTQNCNLPQVATSKQMLWSVEFDDFGVNWCWVVALKNSSQIVYSTSNLCLALLKWHCMMFLTGFGTGICLLPFHHLLISPRDALMTSTINCVTSFISGFAIFSILGYMAHVYKVKIQDVATEGKNASAHFPRFKLHKPMHLSFLVENATWQDTANESECCRIQDR